VPAVPRRNANQLVLIREPLDGLYRTFDHVDSASDPVHIVRRFRSNEDREVVGFCAAALAFGRVASVLQSIESLLKVMGPAPAAFVRGFRPDRDAAALRPLVHRWIRGVDLAALILILQRMLRESGSIESFFVAGDDPQAPDVAPPLDAFSARAMQTDLRPAYGRMPERPGVCYFFPRLCWQRVQTAQPVPSLDGTKGLDRPRRLVAGAAVTARRSAGYPRDSRRPLPQADEVREPGVEDGC
jgi:hypothetical protein